MTNPYSAPQADPERPQDSLKNCPVCGHVPSATQFVFYPKPNMIKCKACHTELKYTVPARVTLVLILIGMALAALSMPLVWPAGWPFIALYFALLFVLAGYAEARYVQRTYPPLPRKS